MSVIPVVPAVPSPEEASELLVLLEGLLVGGLPGDGPIDLSFKIGLYRPTVRKTGSFASFVMKRGQP